MTDTSWSWTVLTLAVGAPGKRIAIDATTLLNAWVAGGFAEKLPHQYRMTLKGQEVDAPPRVPIAVYGAGMTAPWTTEEGVDSLCPIN